MHSPDATARDYEAYLRLGVAAFADRIGFFRGAAVAKSLPPGSQVESQNKTRRRFEPSSIGQINSPSLSISRQSWVNTGYYARCPGGGPARCWTGPTPAILTAIARA